MEQKDQSSSKAKKLLLLGCLWAGTSMAFFGRKLKHQLSCGSSLHASGFWTCQSPKSYWPISYNKFLHCYCISWHSCPFDRHPTSKIERKNRFVWLSFQRVQYMVDSSWQKSVVEDLLTPWQAGSREKKEDPEKRYILPCHISSNTLFPTMSHLLTSYLAVNSSIR